MPKERSPVDPHNEERIRQLDVLVLRKADWGHGFPESPCVDFGRYIEREPWFVLKPATVDSLRSCVAWLSDRRIAFKVRGAAHSSGGQVLIGDGAVIDISGLRAVSGIDSERELISVQGGALWQDVVIALRPLGRIPMVWTNNLRTTVAGTLSVGGFGATSARHGAQIDQVESLTILTLDGEIHECASGDPLFEYSLAGRGQLGVIVEARIRTTQRRFRWMGIRVRWESYADYAGDMKMMIEESAHDYLLAKTTIGQNSIDGLVGDVWGGGKIGNGPWPKKARRLEVVSEDLFHTLVRDYDPWPTAECVPALEFILPLDAGLSVWTAIEREFLTSDMVGHFKDNQPSIGVLRGRSRHPLAPLPGTDFAIGVALRPVVSSADIGRVLPILRQMAFRILDAGGRIYMMSIDLGGRQFLARQSRDHFAEFASLKQKYDPHGLLNPGLFDVP